MRKLLETMSSIQQVNEGPYDDRISRAANEINSQNPDGVYAKDLVNTILQVGAELNDFEVTGSPQAKKDYVKDVSKLVKKRRDNRRQQDNKTRVDNALQSLMTIIDEEIGNSFPDSDPFDKIYQRARKLGIPADQMIEWFDRAVKKYSGGFKNYNEYLKMMWDEFSSGNMGSNEYSDMKNPWG